jgi:IS30 family transposase
MSKTYNHLSLEDRAVIQVMLDHSCSLRAIARKLRRSASTIPRELARSGGTAADASGAPGSGRPRIACGYRCAKAHHRAQRLARKARVACKMVHGNPLWDRVIETLRTGLSPEQASGILQRMPEPAHISHESIYTALYAMPMGELRSQILELLARGHKTRRPRSAGTDRRGLIPGATSIDERPTDINERLVPGHWEGDPTQGGEKPVADRNPGGAQDLVHRLGGAGQRHG